MFVDSLTKTASAPQHGALGAGSTDASKVLAKGLGLSKAYVGQKSSFTVDCSKAGGCPHPCLAKIQGQREDGMTSAWEHWEERG